jgi:CubicO group peptidase (beta-lactamase class C family)
VEQRSVRQTRDQPYSGNADCSMNDQDIRYYRRSLHPRFRSLSRLLLSLALGVLVFAPNARLRADDYVNGRFGEYLDSLRVQTGIPGLAAAVVGRSDILWERAFGYQDTDRAIAARTDTPVHVDGLTEMFTATLVMRCVEQGRLSLDDYIGRFKASSPDANLTVRQVLTQTSDIGYSYRPDRIDVLSLAVRSCTGDSFRETLANLLDQVGMADSVPGPDVIYLVPPAEGVLTSEFERYGRILTRLAVPYAVDAQKRTTRSAYSATTLTPTSGLISTVHDLAKFDVSLKSGVVMQNETLATAWRATGGPHSIGWFVQTYNGEKVVWQFGAGENGSSSMAITLPARSLTLILLANSNGLTKGFGLTAGDILASPFARAFLGLYAI